MQIHELTKKQLNEVDLAGPEGLASQTKTAYQAAKQPGALGSLVKSQQSAPSGSGMLQRAKTALASNPLTSTAALAQSDFVKTMQAIKNNAAMKQVAANIQQQWEQTRKTFSASPATASTTAATPPTVNYNVPAYLRKQKSQAAQQSPTSITTSAPGYSSVKTNAPPGVPTVGGSKLPQPTVAASSTKATPAKSVTAPANNAKTVAANADISPNRSGLPGTAELDKFNQRVAQAMKQQSVTEMIDAQESPQLTEAASMTQVTDWFKTAVIPQSMSGYEAEYLQNPTIQATLKNIVAAENQTDDKKRQELQAAEFLNLVSAAGAVSQAIQAKQPQVAATAGAGATAPQAPGVQAATTQLQKLAGLNPTQIEAIKKIFSGAPQVRTGDPNTANFLQALGIKTS
jgi:hypothetical protein